MRNLSFSKNNPYVIFSRRRRTTSDFSAGPYDKPAIRVTIASIIGALYATMVIVFWFSAFSVAQVRVADCLMPLALLFGYPAAVGLSVGCIVGNYYGFATGMTVAIDVIGGPVANFVAAVLGYKIYRILVERGRKGFAWAQIPILVENIMVTLIVGTYLPIFYAFPGADSYLVSAVFWYIGLFIGSLISMNALGYAIYRMTYAGLL